MKAWLFHIFASLPWVQFFLWRQRWVWNWLLPGPISFQNQTRPCLNLVVKRQEWTIPNQKTAGRNSKPIPKPGCLCWVYHTHCLVCRLIQFWVVICRHRDVSIARFWPRQRCISLCKLKVQLPSHQWSVSMGADFGSLSRFSKHPFWEIGWYHDIVRSSST